MRRLVYQSVAEDDLRRLAAAVGQLAEAIIRQLHSDVAKIVEQWDREWAGEPTDEKIQEELFDDYAVRPGLGNRPGLARPAQIPRPAAALAGART